MNSCILMAEIIKEPELRYTPDSQTAIASLRVQFPGQRLKIHQQVYRLSAGAI
jgi:single-stranded DNA-binding protein